MRLSEWDSIVLKLNHTGRTHFFTQEEYANMFGQHNVDVLLEQYGSWEDICETLKQEGLRLEMQGPPVSMSAEVSDIMNTLKSFESPTDFKEMPHIQEALRQCISEFYMAQGFVPTISQATKDYNSYFPDTRHYLETFGTWENACRDLEVPKEHLPTFKDEIKHTVNYYNNKHGRQPGRLMLRKEWDLMVTKREVGKGIPSASHMAQYVKVDRENTEYGAPKNSWEAIADIADLDCDKRGNAASLERMHDKEMIMRRYTNACLKAGHIMNLKDWDDFCKTNGRSYRPPDSSLVKKYFGGIRNLKQMVETKIYSNKKVALAFEETRVAKIQAAAGASAEMDIFKTLENVEASWHEKSVEMDERTLMH